MSLSLFPDVIGEQESLTPFFSTDVSRMGENSFQRFRKASRPRYIVDLAWQLIAESDALSFENQILSTLGASQQFDWFDWVPFYWMWLRIGTGDGTTTVWDLPAKQTSNRAYLTGSGTAVSGVASTGTGTNGRDQVTISPAVASGLPIWCNLTGRRCFQMQFESDDQPLTSMLDPDGYYQLSTRLVGVK